MQLEISQLTPICWPNLGHPSLGSTKFKFPPKSTNHISFSSFQLNPQVTKTFPPCPYKFWPAYLVIHTPFLSFISLPSLSSPSPPKFLRKPHLLLKIPTLSLCSLRNLKDHLIKFPSLNHIASAPRRTREDIIILGLH